MWNNRLIDLRVRYNIYYKLDEVSMKSIFKN